jgi:hypothetical protein
MMAARLAYEYSSTPDCLVTLVGRVCCASRRIVTRHGQLLTIVADASLHHFERDEALHVGAELGHVFGRGAGAVFLKRAIDDALRERWIERAARALGHERERVTLRAEVPAVRV